MNALLQGDVGCGKTMVALYAMLKAVENGRQAILMAPTEILAEQHAAGIHGRLDALLGENGLEVALLTGSRSHEEKAATLETLASGKPALVVGTHALFERNVKIQNAGLIVIDEQHRFGVGQRAALKKKGAAADLLIMTATPIPRTLALALYGNFETIIIDEYPHGRLPIETRHIDVDGRDEMGRVIERLIGEEGRQAFVVCPEIDPRSEPTARPVANVERAYRKYSRRFPDFRIDVIHGKMTPDERESAIGRFHSGETQILVATTIIEVGVDAPNAAVIVIEGADRFGLAQLHQLRGRVGRSKYQSYCFLAAEPTTEAASKRIEIMIDTGDGFEISEHDLLLRGPGEFLGSAQSGVPPLRAGHLLRDAPLLERARACAEEMLRRDPSLESPENKPIRTLLEVAPSGAAHY
jgi:ATP-dependent DNA helicase RecG